MLPPVLQQELPNQKQHRVLSGGSIGRGQEYVPQSVRAHAEEFNIRRQLLGIINPLTPKIDLIVNSSFYLLYSSSYIS